MPEVQEVKFVEELKKMDYEPLLPIEKKLIIWSLGIGTGLLAILIVVSHFLLDA
jgi:hypothetical protein